VVLFDPQYAVVLKMEPMMIDTVVDDDCHPQVVVEADGRTMQVDDDLDDQRSEMKDEETNGNDAQCTMEDDVERITILRDPKDREVFKMSIKLIETYKYINKVI
jgi:hypothetical protein